MAVIDLTEGYGSAPVGAYNPSVVYERIVDFSATPAASADTLPLFDLPAGLHIIMASVEVLREEGGTATIALGVTGGDVDKYIDGADLNSAGMTSAGDAATSEPVSLELNGAYLSAAETVSILANNALDNAVIRVMIVALDLRGQLTDPTA